MSVSVSILGLVKNNDNKKDYETIRDLCEMHDIEVPDEVIDVLDCDDDYGTYQGLRQVEVNIQGEDVMYGDGVTIDVAELVEQGVKKLRVFCQ